jgi:hypothetical protein
MDIMADWLKIASVIIGIISGVLGTVKTLIWFARRRRYAGSTKRQPAPKQQPAQPQQQGETKPSSAKEPTLNVPIICFGIVAVVVYFLYVQYEKAETVRTKLIGAWQRGTDQCQIEFTSQQRLIIQHMGTPLESTDYGHGPLLLLVGPRPVPSDPPVQGFATSPSSPPTPILENGEILSAFPPVLRTGWCGEWQE